MYPTAATKKNQQLGSRREISKNVALAKLARKR